MRNWIGLGVSLHLLAVTLQALPSPSGGLSKQAWADPTVQAEFDRWAERLGLDDADLEASLWTFATRWEAGRQLVLAPFYPYYRYCGAWQSWKMFVAPHTHPTRLVIEIEEDGRWRRVFTERSATETWLSRKLGHDRLRAIIFRMGWPQYGVLRKQFTTWAAGYAAKDFPKATRIKVWFEKSSTLPAEAIRAGEVESWEGVLSTLASVPR